MATTFPVANESDLNNAIQAIDAGGADSATNTAYTINITGSIDLITDLPVGQFAEPRSGSVPG
jgi:hypothetical protein